ncbi:MAG: hypothetical protein LBE12_08790 [Planctomycetaceae bacterium]|jgi:hypothetical protein|nr:hypothetical protein [Planctomycetaceae bacterium]
MAIEVRDITLGLCFEAYGIFVSVYVPDAEGRKPVFRFEYLGGQFSVEVEESEVLTPPQVGTAFHVLGKVRYNSYNGSIALVPEHKKQLQELSPEQFVKGLRVWGAGVVEEKKQTVMNRNTYLNAAIKWQGGLHLFTGLSPEIFQRVPPRGQFVRFELGVTSHSERTASGQQIQMMVPFLVSVTPETMSSSLPASGNSIPSSPVSSPSKEPDSTASRVAGVLGSRAKAV